MRDRADNVVVVCSIENFDPMGVHTGDSITVAPAQTLTDKEYQRLRDAAFAVIREIGVETGGSNIQFALHPHNARLVAIEMNPRVSRSSALASKATGFPIAKIAAKLALGYTLDELPNDITRSTPAGFEPTLDYVVVKVPRFAFEKFPAADPKLTTQMKSVGEVMTIGRTFKEAFQKAWRGLETGHAGFGRRRGRPPETNEDRMRLTSELAVPTVGRVSAIYQALHDGFTVEEIHEITKIDRWFLQNLSELTTQEKELRKVASLETASCEQLLAAKRSGFSDAQLASFWNVKESVVRARRLSLGVRAGYKLVDTCAAEFEAATPYYYSAYESESETRVSDKKKIMIIGGGPNRIGQGIEFDYCCCHAAYALRELGFESIMINSNPETVSTDYDTSDLLFFEPLTVEDVLNIHDALKPDGAIVQFGGQTPLNLARRLREAGVNIVGTAVEEIERAGNRKLFNALIKRLKLVQPPGEAAMGPAEALQIAERIGYPVLVRPSFVLGGRAMEICHDPEQARNFLKEAFEVAEDAPVLVDKFIEDAIEVDVDAVSDGQEVIIAGMLEHIEEAGTHSGDAGMCLPPHSLSDAQCAKLADITRRLAGEMRVCGLINVQFAVKGGTAYILEVNPRASRTVPFIGKATGVPWAKIAAKCMVGVSLREQGVQASPPLRHLAVKESVFPFNKFPGNDILLGPEMKSTGEVMGIDVDFGRAFAKAQMAAGQTLPQSGNVFLSVCDKDKREGALLAERLQQLGYQILTTAGTHKTLARLGIHSTVVLKISEGKPNLLDYVENGQLAFAINTPSGRGHYTDEAKIRSTLVVRNIPCFTTMAAAHAVVTGISRIKNGYDVKALQDYYAVRG
jgi:carbamoyl-phosphate synthase large subunit